MVLLVLRTALTIMVVAGAVELVARTAVFPEWTSLSIQTFERHPQFGHFNVPNLVARRYNPPNYDVTNRTNSRGFRDRDAGFADDLQGIWIAGGSNTFAGGVEDDEVYAARLESFGYRTANLASEGHTILQQAAVMRHLAGEGYRPRAIVLELTLNGVLADRRSDLSALNAPLVPSGTPALTPSDRPSVLLTHALASLDNRLHIDLTAIKQRMIRHSATYGWMKVGINASPTLRDLALRLGLRADIALSGHGAIELYKNIPQNPTDVWIDSTAEFVARLNRWTEDIFGVPFIALIVPSHLEVYPDRFDRLMHSYGIAPTSASPARPRTELIRRLQQRGVEILDITAAFRTSGRNDLVFPDDAHMTAPAHALVAEIIAEVLRQRGLTPDLP